MGITSHSFALIKRITELQDIKSVCDLGAQNDYRDEHIVRSGVPHFKYPFISDYWKNHSVQYLSIDLNGENDSMQWDLRDPLPTKLKFDLVTDFGTSEHVHNLYQCFSNVDALCKVGGIMVHKNPKTGSWPLHGYHFFTEGFYIELAKAAGYQIIDRGEQAAMGNAIDGWEIYCILKKINKEFIKEDQFPKTETK